MFSRRHTFSLIKQYRFCFHHIIIICLRLDSIHDCKNQNSMHCKKYQICNVRSSLKCTCPHIYATYTWTFGYKYQQHHRAQQQQGHLDYVHQYKFRENLSIPSVAQIGTYFREIVPFVMCQPCWLVQRSQRDAELLHFSYSDRDWQKER